MATRDVILIGASAGGIVAMHQLLAVLPADLPASVFLTLHLSPYFSSNLDQVLGRSSQLPVKTAEDLLPIERGTVYVAPPDRHLVFADGVMRLERGPKENLHRPCINVMFRSAAEQYGERAIGVILSGLLDDGAAGLWEIQQRGGVTIAQDPEDAEYPSMPPAAIQGFKVDYVARLAEVGMLLDGLTRQTIDEVKNPTAEVSVMERTNQVCPDCGGAMQLARMGTGLEEYRCHVGHRMAPESMIVSKEETVQWSMWNGLSQLEELIWLMQERAEAAQEPRRSELRRKIGEKQRMAAELRGMLNGPAALQRSEVGARANPQNDGFDA
jgi:two-component system, chemotaxis family, protein-glutamate methylesterase/glutaminase